MQALLKFHTTYYSADIMKLAVIGREPLDKMQVRVYAFVLVGTAPSRTRTEPARRDEP